MQWEITSLLTASIQNVMIQDESRTSSNRNGQAVQLIDPCRCCWPSWIDQGRNGSPVGYGNEHERVVFMVDV